MKRIGLAAVVLAVGAGGAAWSAAPDAVREWGAVAARAAERAWAGVEANPAPAIVAAVTFVLTVVYHAARGKTLRESVEVAATRVTVVSAPRGVDDEAAVVRRARARATRTQLLADQIGVQNRLRKLPDAIARAEKESCYAEQAVADAERVLADRRQAQDAADAALDGLRAELATGLAECEAMEAELKKLADRV